MTVVNFNYAQDVAYRPFLLCFFTIIKKKSKKIVCAFVCIFKISTEGRRYCVCVLL